MLCWRDLECEFDLSGRGTENRVKLISNSMVKEASNVIIRNLGVKKVLADNGDALAVREYSISDQLFTRLTR